MARQYKSYDESFKKTVVKLYENSKGLSDLSREYGIGKTFNADINGALNIMRKSSVVDTNILYGRGEVDTPIRIRIA